MIDAARGLTYLHENGVVHSDIKPVSSGHDIGTREATDLERTRITLSSLQPDELSYAILDVHVCAMAFAVGRSQIFPRRRRERIVIGRQR